MTKQEWINQAYDCFVEAGVGADEKTWDWAEILYDCEEETYKLSGLDFLEPSEAVAEELQSVAESQ